MPKGILICDLGRVKSVAALCSKYGLGIELQGFCRPWLLDNVQNDILESQQSINKINLRSLHGCFYDLCPGSSDPAIREVVLHRFEFSYRTALQHNANHLILHHGYIPNTSFSSSWIKRSSDLWTFFINDKPDMLFHMENLLDRDPDVIIKLIETVGSAQLDVVLDIGHVHCHSKIPITSWIKRLARHIGYVHLHDNHGNEDEHLAFGQGTLPMQEVCEALEIYAPQAYWAIETHIEGIEASVNWLADHNFILDQTNNGREKIS